MGGREGWRGGWGAYPAVHVTKNLARLLTPRVAGAEGTLQGCSPKGFSLDSAAPPRCLNEIRQSGTMPLATRPPQTMLSPPLR